MSEATDQTTAGGRREVPQMITGRFRYDDAHTIDRYRATEGYAALRKALEMHPEDVHAEVKNASLLGRGGAGFPAGVKWGFCPPGVWPRYLVVNGDESEPGTYKDRLLMERDPHQLIEGVLIAAYAVGCGQAFLYVRGEMAHGRAGRASRVLGRVWRHLEHGDVVLVGHGHHLRVLAAVYLRQTPYLADALELEAGSLSVLGHHRTTPTVHRWNLAP